MNNELWKKIDDRICDTFAKPNEKFKKELISSIAIHILNPDKIIKSLGKKNWLILLSEFFYAIKKIMNYYDVDYISNHNDVIYGRFETPTKEKIQKIFECAVNLNTFKQHFNKRIAKNIIDVKLDKNELIIDFGIGLVFSKENYQQSSSQKNVNTLFKSESVDLAITLALLANSKENSPILFNELIVANFTKKYLKDNKNIVKDFETYKIKNKTIYGCSLINVDYNEWIKRKL